MDDEIRESLARPLADVEERKAHERREAWRAVWRAALWFFAFVGAIKSWHWLLDVSEKSSWERTAMRVGSVVEGEWSIRFDQDGLDGRLTVSNGHEEQVYAWRDEPDYAFWPPGR